MPIIAACPKYKGAPIVSEILEVSQGCVEFPGGARPQMPAYISPSPWAAPHRGSRKRVLPETGTWHHCGLSYRMLNWHGRGPPNSPLWCPEALPEWRGQKKASGHMLADSSKENHAQRLKVFFHGEATEAPRGKASLAEAKRANEGRMRALDHGLQAGLGMSLSLFRVAEPCAPLTPQQRRYFVPISALSPEVQSVACGRGRRACLWNSAREVGRLEVMWSADRRALHDASDMGRNNLDVAVLPVLPPVHSRLHVVRLAAPPA